MGNPFEEKSLAEIRAMVPDLADADLDALAACVCNGVWLRWNPKSGPSDREWYWQAWVGEGWYPLYGVHYDYRPTTDPVHAMRLQEKYHINVTCFQYSDGDRWEARAGYGHIEAQFGKSLCRVRTEAGLVAELKKREHIGRRYSTKGKGVPRWT